MRIFISAFVLGFIKQVNANCMPVSEIQFQVEVLSCQITTFESDVTMSAGIVKAENVAVSYVSGRVLNVKELPEFNPDEYWKKPINNVAIGHQFSFVINSKSVCSELKNEFKPKLQTVTLCCDMLPRQGLCNLPLGLPIVKFVNSSK
jgi:hypothetical protein